MENFSQLLNQYVQRAGISDVELARTIGVSRQTIFRWREGTTARPRHREDVLAIARKLRLSPKERDRLLLAAGFWPEEGPEQEYERAEKQRGEGLAEFEVSVEAKKVEVTALLSRWIVDRYRWWLVAAVVGALLLVGATGWWFNWGQTGRFFDDTPTVNFVANAATPSGSSSVSAVKPIIVPAASGEIMILVTHFANYASSQIGYNVAGRLAQTLQQEIDHTPLEDIRIVIWPEEVSTREQALQIGQTVNATLVIYGEYDVGRVMVEFAYPADQSVFIDPALQQYVADVQELSATINSNLPQQVRSLALLALGQIYLKQNEANQARPLLAQACDNFKDDPAIDEKTWALANFYLGFAAHDSRPPDLDEAIKAYTQAIEAWPGMLSSRLNRSAAYTSRAQPGDLEKALADMDYIVSNKPTWALAYSNRASILINMGGDDNLALAQTDLEKALELNPDLPGAYLHRAYMRYKQDKPMEQLVPDLEKTLALRPDDTSALNLFCWGYAVEQQPEKALPYCEQMVEIDPRPIFRDSRGLTYALLGDYEAAIADFEVFVAWLEAQSNEVWQQPLARRQAWLETLQAGENPFTPEVLAEIRHEFGK
jgi:tetratricopeptide (TPR) repeat protein/DNA-binding XRE family transcriptional regulator